MSPRSKIVSCATDLPIHGFSWSMFFCQHVGLQQASCADLPLSLPVITRWWTASSFLCRTTLWVFAGTTPTAFGAASKEGDHDWIGALTGYVIRSAPQGLAVHGVTLAALSAETLGMRIIPSSRCLRTCRHAYFRLRSGRCCGVLMHRPRASGRVVPLIAGHLSFGAIASPGALSLVDSVYKFAAKHPMSCGIPWDSLNCELRAFAALRSSVARRLDQLLVPRSLLLGCLRKRILSCAARVEPVSLSSGPHGRVLERSRFRGPGGSERAQEHAFQQLGLVDPASGR